MLNKYIINLNVLHNTLQSKRNFWRWLTIIFNSVDKHRLNQVGPDRICAEWLLKNGAAVKWKSMSEYLRDYNSLPEEGKIYFIEKVDATDSAIHHIGFEHFRGCHFINEIKLVKCSYIENEAMSHLSILKESLTNLEVIECKNITDDGLKYLKNLRNLEYLKIGGLPYVKDFHSILSELRKALPKCNLVHEKDN